MKFTLLLFFLKKKMVSRAAKDPAFKDRLKEKNFTIVIKTVAGKGRFFTFEAGEVISKGKNFPDGQVALVWKDGATAISVMASGSNEKMMKALQAGDLKIEGDAQLALWFAETAKIMMRRPKK